MNKEDLIRLYNTMLTIETKGVHTKTMADCLRFIEQHVNYEPPKEDSDEERKVS